MLIFSQRDLYKTLLPLNVAILKVTIIGVVPGIYVSYIRTKWLIKQYNTHFLKMKNSGKPTEKV